MVDYFDPFSLVEGEVPVKEVPKGYYITQALSDRAVQEVEEYAKDDKPFFMYLAYTAPHWPLHALPEDIEKYKDTYKVGWEAIRNARYERQKQLGIFREWITSCPNVSSMTNGKITRTQNGMPVRWLFMLP